MRRAGDRRTASSGEQGFTLLELLIGLTLVALVIGVVGALLVTGARAAKNTNSFLQTQAQVRAGLDNMVEEIRWAQEVRAAAAQSVTLFVPQSTPFSASSPYTVTFAYNAADDTITRQEDPDADGPQPAGPPTPIAYLVVDPGGGAGLTLEYFDTTGTSLGSAPPSPGDVSRVRIFITTTKDGFSRTFAGDAALRGRL
ncbi:MAG: prepilin-type N-terminal cleavage/methylation domain-containing protein [Armatimonadota bacterium]|nr:prepilin-type N-terminal cleavage/methylation domain-containing protein [Armatimonadota bacterium]MDR7450430.1 prepilin-type N-terminal cleavage/methylation domain-containing protein [Armatimonadota bacterium]MDR7466987.1 prepilin-type N-terminal cleavage/methylation domain-containing protein [Armatimonadota bacterium]MDR7493471.1 prepilin-type N-terminal cleavage/methylation domain-containing protein [Armatimonadota bacterium]MDR7498736.1 prepilin-type N-terminal cleavage/methylation domain